jgi:2-oxoglutarate/2-oxoacid ferredoxin oxidoreductase subunit beta
MPLQILRGGRARRARDERSRLGWSAGGRVPCKAAPEMAPKPRPVPREHDSSEPLAGDGSEVRRVPIAPGFYRTVTGNEAIALGLLAAARLAGLRGFVASSAPGADIVREVSRHQNFDFATCEAEDEINACCAAIGAAYGGALACMITSARGVVLEREAIRLAATAGLPIVIVDVQRGGPSTGLARKSTVPVLAASSPSDCFDRAIEAARIAVARLTPVVLLLDGSVANARGTWKVPEMSDLEVIDAPSRTDRSRLPTHRPGAAARWCPSCGDDSILAQAQKALAGTGIAREEVVFVSGIGCSSPFASSMSTHGFRSIHGPGPATATGLKAVRPELQVWAVTSDPGVLSAGGNHFIHALRRNVDVKILLFNDREGTPSGPTVEPLQLAVASGATFVARSIDVAPDHLDGVLQRMAAHEGAAFLEILTRPRDPIVAAVGEDGMPWDEHAPASAAYALAGLRAPTPIGVFRAVEEPTHHELEQRRRDEARKQRGEPDLEALLRAGDTRLVGP